MVFCLAVLILLVEDCVFRKISRLNSKTGISPSGDHWTSQNIMRGGLLFKITIKRYQTQHALSSELVRDVYHRRVSKPKLSR